MHAQQSGGLQVGRRFYEAMPTLGIMATLVLGKVREKQQEELQPIKYTLVIPPTSQSVVTCTYLHQLQVAPVRHPCSYTLYSNNYP